MSTHVIAVPAASPGDVVSVARIEAMRRATLDTIGRQPTITDSGESLTLTFTPDLDTAESNALRRVLASAGLLRVTRSEWDGIEADIDGLRTYHGLASPTAAQTAQATKALIRVLRAVLRD